MRLLNTKNPDDVAKIYPWIVSTESETQLDIATELYGMLKEKPDNVFMLIAIERNITRAVVIAHVSEVKRKSIWLWQSNVEPGFKYSKLMFDLLKNWAKSKKAKEIRIGTNDRHKAFARRWGFKDYTKTIMRLRIK